MSRLAVVTGGTRGIGEAISVALKDAGYRVVANYAGNDQAAEEFKGRTGIPVAKFDVSDFQSCEDAVKRIEEEHGPIEVLVNNAGITRDATMHKMSFQQWNEVIQTNLSSCFNMCHAVISGMRERGFGRIVNIGSINGQLRRRQVRHSRLHQGSGPGGRSQGHHRECDCAGLHRHRHGARRAGEGAGKDRRTDPGGTAGRGP